MHAGLCQRHGDGCSPSSYGSFGNLQDSQSTQSARVPTLRSTAIGHANPHSTRSHRQKSITRGNPTSSTIGPDFDGPPGAGGHSPGPNSDVQSRSGGIDEKYPPSVRRVLGKNGPGPQPLAPRSERLSPSCRPALQRVGRRKLACPELVASRGILIAGFSARMSFIESSSPGRSATGTILFFQRRLSLTVWARRPCHTPHRRRRGATPSWL